MAMQDLTGRSATAERPRIGHDGGVPVRKLSIPRLPSTWLRRERLHRLFDAACERQLLVVTSPPGGGKTSALSSWATCQTERRVAWVSLDGQDGARGRFWGIVAAAVRESSGVCPADQADRRVRQVRPQAETVLRALEAMSPGVLVLDEFDVVRDGAVLAEVGELLRQLPPEVTVMVAGRGEPAIPFARLSAAEEVATIGYGALRLSPAESEALFSAVARRPLQAEQLDKVVARTQGWPVAVRLAGLQLRDASDPAVALEAVTTDCAWIAAYVEEELLSGISAPVRRLLCQGALVDRLTPELCAALTAEPCPASTFAQMIGHDGLLVGDRGGGYRLHPLVAEVLRTRLARDEPAAYAAGHGRVARYFESEGDLPAARRHFEAAGERERAFEIAAREAIEHLRTGTAGAAPRRFGQLRALTVVDGDDPPARTLAGALGSLVAGDAREAARWLEVSERAMAGGAASGRPSRRRAVLAACAAALGGDLVAMRDEAHAALVPDADAARGAGTSAEPGWLCVLDELTPLLASTLLARASLWLGDAPAAARVALEAGRGVRDARFALALDGVRAASMARLGDLSEASHLALTALRSAETHGLAGDPAGLEAELALGWAHRERGELLLSREHLATAARSAERGGSRPLQVLVELEVVPTLLASDELGTAFDVLSRRRRAYATAPSPAAGARLDALELDWRLAAGDAAGAARALEKLAPEQRTPVLEARVDLLFGRPARALARLDEAGLRAGTAVPERMQYLVVAARAAHQAGALHRARDAVHRALELGRSEELVRPFFESGHEIAWLLRALERGYPDPYLERVLSAVGRANGPAPTDDAPVVLVEGLTDREREALRRLPTHLTQQQIAAELYVSVNTLKTHLKGLYRKLGATSRAEAVAAARLRGLV